MLTYTLERTAPEPLYVQLYQGIRADIASEKLTTGQQLPSKRALAAHLGVSVITVEGAFAQLAAEGYIEPRPRRGFFVCTAEGLRAENSVVGMGGSDGSDNRRGAVNQPAVATATAGSSAQHPVSRPSASPLLADFTGASPAVGSFPYAAWARTMRRVLSEGDEATLLSCSDGRGTYRLRSAIAGHLRGFRGMDVLPDQVVVGSGAQSLYGLLVQLLGRDRTFGVESPGYPRMARIYQAHGVPLQPIGLDEKGPLPQQLHDSDASVFHCMPSHQFPTGVTTTVGRRQALLEWAAEPAHAGTPPDAHSTSASPICPVDAQPRYLIEDDYDCEFRMSGRPVPPLQAMDAHERVIYMNTFTKTLGAAFRIGYLVLPPHLVCRFQDRLGFYACSVGALEQLTLARFIESGEYERHVNRRRTRLRKVQDALVKALGEEARRAGIDNGLRLRNVGAGLHFVMEVDEGSGLAEASACRASDPGASANRAAFDAPAVEEAVADRALTHGVALAPLSAYRLDGLCDIQQRPAAHGPQGASTASRCASFVMSFASLAEGSIGSTARIIIDAASVRDGT